MQCDAPLMNFVRCVHADKSRQKLITPMDFASFRDGEGEARGVFPLSLVDVGFVFAASTGT